MKHIGSVITGTRKADNVLTSATGTGLSTTGSEKLLSTASERLLASKPRETDAALEALLVPSVISCLGDVVHRYHNTRGEFVVESRPGVKCACTSISEASKAFRAYERACLPAPDEKVYTALAALRTLTKVAAAETDDIKFQIQVYARQLRAYPGDVVLHVLSTQPNLEKWWPAWSELKERLELYAGRRWTKRDQLRELVAKSESYSAASE